jgi:malonyl CoA-acyl carrier protein transacylase
MKPAGKAFEEFLRDFDFQPLQLKVIANATGQPYTNGEPNTTLRHLLVKQISEPVKWTHSVRYLLNAGATDFREVGPGTVLTRLIDQIKRSA